MVDLCGVFCVVDIATEWNLKTNERDIEAVKDCGRYSNRMEFKGSLTTIPTL